MVDLSNLRWLIRVMALTSDDVVQDIKSRLVEAASSRKSAMHTMVVGTADGEMRVMVLRDFDPAGHILRFHTDARSPKVSAIQADAQLHVLAFDPEAKVQIRMRGAGRVEQAGPIADAAWNEATTFARRCYLAEAAPSSESDKQVSGLPDWAEGVNPTEEQVAPARANFAALLIDVTEFDWLFLDNDGHRRARVTRQLDKSDRDFEFSWLVP